MQQTFLHPVMHIPAWLASISVQSQAAAQAWAGHSKKKISGQENFKNLGHFS